MSIRLPRLPERGAVKITFTAGPELKAALTDYAEIYARTYGQKEDITQLIPFMLEAFMNADTGFKRARRQLQKARSSSTTHQDKET